jgi:hypothetical protein
MEEEMLPSPPPNTNDAIIDAEIEYVSPQEPGDLPAQEVTIHPNDQGEVANSPALPERERAPSPLLQEEQTPRWSRGSLIIVLLGVLLVLSVVITTAVVVGQKKKNEDQLNANANHWDPETRMYEIKAMLSAEASDPSSFLEPRSSQARALDWLVYEDTLLTSAQAPNLFQRYALIVFAFATNAELWRAVDPWYELTGSHECSFIGVDCNLDEQVISIDLHLKRVSGTLPEEIGLLTELAYLLLGINYLEGSIPDSMFQKLTKLGKWSANLNFLFRFMNS